MFSILSCEPLPFGKQLSSSSKDAALWTAGILCWDQSLAAQCSKFCPRRVLAEGVKSMECLDLQHVWVCARLWDSETQLFAQIIGVRKLGSDMQKQKLKILEEIEGNGIVVSNL